jgi:hypothetical protein
MLGCEQVGKGIYALLGSSVATVSLQNIVCIRGNNEGGGLSLKRGD